MSFSQLAQIVVPRPFRTALTYLVPTDLKLQVGARVVVPLAKQQSIGLVLALNSIAPEANTASNLKPLDAILDADALVDAHLLQFLQWAAEYYHHPLGEVIFHALPANLRKPKPVSKRLQPLLPAQPAAANRANSSHSSLNLSDEQAACLSQLQTWTAEHKPILLHGITGSGKTEIYLRLMQPLIAKGEQVLMLVPEIGLTPQLLQRVSEFFAGISIVNLHSGLSDGERLKAWLQARNGSAQIIIGTRSAVFTPAPQLALIIIDEEHDASFKQQEGFHYHGRDLAIKRAAMLKIPLLLGTATPALETLQNVAAKRFHYAKLEQRPGSTRLPKLLLQDTRQLNLHAGLTPPSLQALEQTLARGEQAMVFLNRRGFAPTLHCPTCGWQASCPHCSVNLTYHARRHRLLCHHCGFEQVTPEHCPSCHNPSITTIGHGTERLEISLQQQFADYPVLRIDRDATQTKQALTDKLEQVYSNAPLILVGTQMLAKGHDFPNLTLVIILEIDQSLFSTDYRALERLGQLLIQVSGRAGRADKPGQVI
ncbi:MAG: replication restart helicase PriA, partial [Thiotrichaceae bacterium]